MRPLVWFRSDLRVTDNAALSAACAAADRGVVTVFTICARQWREHDWADAKVEFLLRNLACLAEGLKRLHVSLLILETPTFAEVPAALLASAREHGCDALYFNREYEVNERRRDDTVTAAFERAGLAVRAFEDTVVVPPDVLRTGSGGFFRVFSPFARAWRARVAQEGAALPEAARRQRAAVCPGGLIPERIDGFDLGRGLPDLWPAGEKTALQRLEEFVAKRVRAYKELRDLPAEDGTSRLSPYLTLGVISPRRCLHEVLAAAGGRLEGGPRGPETWISELIWREFYRHVLVGFPRVSMHRPFRLESERVRWRDAPEELRAWQAGRTGIPIVDAGMRQLAATGWMHNRVRMITAMFLSKNLLIDWRAGERHFMRGLVDGDLASNNGGWQWSASTGTDAAPYFRVFNPYLQSRKFDPEGRYIREYVEELRGLPAEASGALHEPGGLPVELRRKSGYPPPMCDVAETRQRAIAAFDVLKDGD